jgi:hypothetical protein
MWVPNDRLTGAILYEGEDETYAKGLQIRSKIAVVNRQAVPDCDWQLRPTTFEYGR